MFPGAVLRVLAAEHSQRPEVMFRKAASYFPLVSLLYFGASTFAHAGGPYGADNGWAINNNGTPLLTSTVASQLSAGETGWIRIEMRLPPGSNTWTSPMLADYDTAVNNARNAGIEVLL